MTNQLNHHDNAIRLLANGFAAQFCEEAAGDERLHDILMAIADEFVRREMPIVSDDDITDVAVELLMRATVREV